MTTRAGQLILCMIVLSAILTLGGCRSASNTLPTATEVTPMPPQTYEQQSDPYTFLYCHGAYGPMRLWIKRWAHNAWPRG